MAENRLGVIAFEKTNDMSKNDELELFELLGLLSKKYNFRWAQTRNPLFLKALAEDLEKDNQRMRDSNE